MMRIKPTSVLFGIKSVLRRKQKNLFAVLAVALGVSLIAGLSITNDSLSVGFGILFTQSLGERDGSVAYAPGFFDESAAEAISNSLLELENVADTSIELVLSVTTGNDDTGQINPGTILVGIDEKDEENNAFGELFPIQGDVPVRVSSLSQDETFVGEALAQTLELDLEINNKLNLTFSFGPFVITETLTVKNIIRSTSRGHTYGNEAIYYKLQNLQTLLRPITQSFNITDPVSHIRLKFASTIDSLNASNMLVEEMIIKIENLPEIQQLGGITLFSVSGERQATIDTATTLADSLNQLLTIFGSLIIFAGLLLISNIQLMSVEAREKQTGIQRAIGTRRLQVIISNLTEFTITGLIGGFFGILGGLLYATILIQVFGFTFEFDGSIIGLQLAEGVLVLAFLSGFTLSLITGLLPSIRASRINIVETLRGVENTAESIDQGTGLWGLYIGLAITLLGLSSISSLDQFPWEFPDAYHSLANAEAQFFATLLFLVGISILLSYFVRQDLALNIAGLLMIIYPMLHIAFVFPEVTEGSGGANYILGMALFMMIGWILIIGINLSRVADAAEAIFGRFSSFSAIAMLSFRQMAAQRTRSTLTFAIFAVILSLNIFIASWSYSDRFGSFNEINANSGGSDIIIVADQPLNESLKDLYLQGLTADNEFSTQILFTRAYASSGETLVYFEDNVTGDTANQNFYSINAQSFWDETNKTEYNLLLDPEKLNPEDHNYPEEIGFEMDQETDFTAVYKESNTEENEFLWRSLAKNTHITVNQTSKPIIIMRPLGEFTPQGGFNIIKGVGDSIWLPAKNGTLKEFIIAAEVQSNPLNDVGFVAQGPEFSTGGFVNEDEARDLLAFNPTANISYVDSYSHFLIKSEHEPLNSPAITELAQDIEGWSNRIGENSFRAQYGLFGIVAISVYELYEIQFDSSFRFFLFIQFFTSFGFVVGILGLLVVSVRSVAERKREIGMMRSIGLKRYEVVLAIVIELSVMGVIGLVIGLIVGNTLGFGLVWINSQGLDQFLIPWELLIFYTVLTLGGALISAIIPGRTAANIPPSEALRYVG